MNKFLKTFREQTAQWGDHLRLENSRQKGPEATVNCTFRV